MVQSKKKITLNKSKLCWGETTVKPKVLLDRIPYGKVEFLDVPLE